MSCMVHLDLKEDVKILKNLFFLIIFLNRIKLNTLKFFFSDSKCLMLIFKSCIQLKYMPCLQHFLSTILKGIFGNVSLPNEKMENVTKFLTLGLAADVIYILIMLFTKS